MIEGRRVRKIVKIDNKHFGFMAEQRRKTGGWLKLIFRKRLIGYLGRWFSGH